MQLGVTAAVLQGTRVSSSDASESGSRSVVGPGMGTGTGTSTEWEWEREWERQPMFPTGTGITSDGHVDRNGQRQMDVSNRETASIRQTCWTVRWTASDGRVGQRDGQCQTDVSDRDGQHLTDASDRDRQRWTSIAEMAGWTKQRKQRKQ